MGKNDIGTTKIQNNFSLLLPDNCFDLYFTITIVGALDLFAPFLFWFCTLVHGFFLYYSQYSKQGRY